MPPPRLGFLTLPGSADRWRTLGLVGESEPYFFGDVRVEFGDPRDAPFALTIEVAATPPAGSLDGLPPGITTTVGEGVSTVDHPVTAVSAVDHVVVLTDDLDRTGSVFAAALGAPRRRIREAGGGRRQGFHLLANTLLEVVEVPGHPPESDALWGVTLSVEDLDKVCATAGDLVSPPKEAVQPGRHIATVRESAGLGVPVALMTPRP